MLSRFQRHLSFLLVAIITTSWLMVLYIAVPIPTAKAQSSTTTSSDPCAATSSADTCENPPDTLKFKDPSVKYNFSYSLVPGSLAMRLTWTRLIASNSGGVDITIYGVQYLPAASAPSGMTGAICASPTNWKDLETFDLTGAGGDKADKTVNDAFSRMTGNVYIRLVAKRSSVTTIGGTGLGTRVTTYPTDHTPPAPLSCGKKPISATTGGGVSDTDLGAKELFKNLQNAKDATYDSGGTGHLWLHDDLTGSPEDINTDGSADPEKPPIVTVSKAATGLTFDMDFTLTNLVRSKTGGPAGTNNNYFLFSPTTLTAEQKTELASKGISDPSIIYLAIDAGANVGILVDNKSVNGGLFAVGKTRFDESSGSLIMVGKFDGNNVGISTNEAGKPLVINLEEYRKFITRRAYNEANLVGGSTCGAVVNYPDLNKEYDKVPTKLPSGGYRECIHVPTASEAEGSKGWLTVWNIIDTQMDAPVEGAAAADPCLESFSEAGWFIQNIIGRSLCTVVNMSMGVAVWLAMFCADFLIEAMGLQ